MTDRPPYDHAQDEPGDVVDHDVDGEYDELRRVRRVRGRAGRVRRAARASRRAAAAILTVLGGRPARRPGRRRRASGCGSQRQIDPPGPPARSAEIEIPEGSTSDDIGELLADEGIISSDLVWGWYLRINGRRARSRPASTSWRTTASIGDVDRRPRRRAPPAGGALLHDPRGPHGAGDRGPPRRSREGPRPRRSPPCSSSSTAARCARSVPASRPALQRGDPLPRDLPGRRRTPTSRRC